MRVAFTLDDIPLWPRSYPPAGYSIASIMQQISDALVRNGIRNVYGFGNTWSLAQHPELGAVLDSWRAAGHHVGNHTHTHPVLTEIDAIRYCGEIDLADRYLEPWLSKAPTRYFRYTLCHWGDTEEKRASVLAHLAARNYKPADVTSWWYEWRATPATSARVKPWPSSSAISSKRV
jgi:peptidoglycan-N-acetylglucosamine deacetylase